jgi:uncharacterized membrane protein
MLSNSFASTLPSVLLGFFITILFAKYALKKTIIRQYKFIAFGVSWILAALISNYAGISDIQMAIIIALVITMFCTISITILVNKK